MNRIQSKSYKIGTYNINKIYLSCSNDKMYILKNRDDHTLVTQDIFVKQGMEHRIFIDYPTNCTTTNVQTKTKL